MGEAFAGTELLTAVGKQPHVGDPAPDFWLDYPDLKEASRSEEISGFPP